ncbi:DUF185-domain-containing protein [Saccharata proteae CBS 121410]|uniref:Protein arginine methyltransferase NDUFAF7 n=1 Tax=Saccharata proteae CBS 121410 TaxID=1314787 RepID=A0A9P4HYH2_9PEZI|nr:DUF185-domain-containing protein [Saccharata proteae CBS 121410]
MRAAVRFSGRALLRQKAPRRAFEGVRWSSTKDRQWSTPLAKGLTQIITATGPVPVAAYMRQCLTSPDGGYYTTRSESGDQFGKKGDFITSPEISQIFGELVGIWIVAEWVAQGRKSSGVQLVEVGPGRGTLMDDMLRTIRNFKPLAQAIDAIYLVEASASLRETQKRLLCGDEAPMKETELGFESSSKYDGLKVIWVEDIRFIPKENTTSPFIVAHEFFDALPIHIFQCVVPTESAAKPALPNVPQSKESQPAQPRRLTKAPEWRELLVSPVPPPASSPSEPHDMMDPPPDFQLTLSKGPTPHSMYLPLTSPRYTAIQSTPDAVIEISPESLAHAADFAVRIGGAPATSTSPRPSNSKPPPPPKLSQLPPGAPLPPSTKVEPSGAALILDYGPSKTIPTNSLRGIRNHQPVSPLAMPGAVDISADVDFLALAESAINASPGVEVHGPVEQARWLEGMGIRERAMQLLQQADGKDGMEEFRNRIEGGWKRLVDRGPNGMGRLYKVLAIVPHVPGRATRRPVGFGGDVKV